MLGLNLTTLCYISTLKNIRHNSEKFKKIQINKGMHHFYHWKTEYLKVLSSPHLIDKFNMITIKISAYFLNLKLTIKFKIYIKNQGPRIA